MNHWAEKTVDLVTTQSYLDQLQKIYPHEEAERDITEETVQEIRTAFANAVAIGNPTELIDQLLSLEKFPYKDSYVGILRKDRTALERNPETVNRVFDRLKAMDVEQLIAGIKQSKEANTRRGPQFRAWLNQQYPVVSLEDFQKAKDQIVLLGGNEKDGLDFCNVVLKLGITKRPDLIVKAGSRYIVGEAKFLSQTGGNQGRGFEDGMKLATLATGNAYKAFVLDGIVWLEKGSQIYKDIDNSNAMILSALLLDEYFKKVAST
jgi:hypothetical protein